MCHPSAPRRTDEGSAPVFQRPERPALAAGKHSNGGSGDRERRSIHMSSLESLFSPALLVPFPFALCVPIPLPGCRPQPPRRVHDRIGGRRFASLSPVAVAEEPLSPLAGGQNQRRFRRRPIAERLGVRPGEKLCRKRGGGRGGKFDSNRLYYRPPPAAALDPLATPKAPSYFLHDDRGERRPTDGDGDTVGAGAAAAVFVAVAAASAASEAARRGGGIEGKWQHDKFVDDEDEA
uniref:Btz domain-containing protein n=1 Tax=Macrostomum lignano TaxID=282301 RepID=A0A1I8FKM1_9PLAT